MPSSSGLPQTTANAPARGPILLAAGLTILTIALLWPGTPAITAMALVTLGATRMTLARFRGHPSLGTILFVHLMIYGALYALFVSASLDAAARSGRGEGNIVLIDLAVSTYPLAIVLEMSWREVRASLSIR